MTSIVDNNIKVNRRHANKAPMSCELVQLPTEVDPGFDLEAWLADLLVDFWPSTAATLDEDGGNNAA